MKNIVFTIVAKNYIGLALILERSIKRYSNDFEFCIVVADEIDEEDVSFALPKNCVIARDFLNFSDDMWEEMSFKYSLTEFCTSIKPSCFLEFFKSYEKAIYLDPDILFFSAIDPVFDELDRYKMILTPHIIEVPKLGSTDVRENIWLNCGIFNLGFLAASKSSTTLTIMEWWHDRLKDFCFIDTYDSLFTDQKWMDFLPSFLSPSELLISKNMGLNVAPWNFFEREIVSRHDGTLFVNRRYNPKTVFEDELMFVHYSAYDYSELLSGNTIQNGVKFHKNYEDIQFVIDHYRLYLIQEKEIFARYIKSSYSYNHYSNGKTIDLFHRRIYRSLLNKREVIRHPFSAAPGSLFCMLMGQGLTDFQSRKPIDKATKLNLSGIGRKLVLINKLSRLIFHVLGYRRYILFIRMLRSYSRFESQIHLADKKYDSTNIL